MAKIPTWHVAVVFVFCTLMIGVYTFEEGAPPAACDGMTPGHGAKAPHKAKKGYPIPTVSIVGEVTEYIPGAGVQAPVKLKVSLEGGFQGCLIQARRADGSSGVPVGRFINPPDNTRLLYCYAEDDSVTHANINKKKGAVFTWLPPEEDVGEVTFVATVAKNINKYWLGLLTPVLRPAGRHGEL